VRDNVTNDKYLAAYHNILRGEGRPKIIDEIIDARRESSLSNKLQSSMLDAADRIERAWREEAIEDHILQMSWHIMELEDQIKRQSQTFTGVVCKVTKAVPPKFELGEDDK